MSITYEFNPPSCVASFLCLADYSVLLARGLRTFEWSWLELLSSLRVRVPLRPCLGWEYGQRKGEDGASENRRHITNFAS